MNEYNANRHNLIMEPFLIAISGIGAIHYHLTDPSKPDWREV